MSNMKKASSKAPNKERIKAQIEADILSIIDDANAALNAVRNGNWFDAANKLDQITSGADYSAGEAEYLSFDQTRVKRGKKGGKK